MANHAIKRSTPRAKKEWPNISTKETDPEYENFYRRCLYLQDDLQKLCSRKLSPRDIDKVLLYLTNKKRE